MALGFAVLACIVCVGCSTNATPTSPTPISPPSSSESLARRSAAEISTSAPPAAATPADAGWTKVSDAVRVDRARGAVRFDATAVIAEGFLEQFVCTVGTREHESLFAFAGKASEIHAAMLLAGIEPGSPGHWRQIPTETGAESDGDARLELVPPHGDEVAITVILPSGVERPLPWFVRASPIAPASRTSEPPSRFVFAGSRFVRSVRAQREYYAADESGSLIGLVTFGDETIGAVAVIPDQVEVSPAVWEVFVGRMPTPGTAVTVEIRRGNSETYEKQTKRRAIGD